MMFCRVMSLAASSKKKKKKHQTDGYERGRMSSIVSACLLSVFARQVSFDPLAYVRRWREVVVSGPGARPCRHGAGHAMAHRSCVVGIVLV